MSEQDKQVTADLDGDGKVSNKERELFLDKLQGQAKLAWIAFITLIVSGSYLMFFADIERMNAAGSGVFDMYWITLASIIGFYFGATTYASAKNK